MLVVPAPVNAGYAAMQLPHNSMRCACRMEVATKYRLYFRLDHTGLVMVAIWWAFQVLANCASHSRISASLNVQYLYVLWDVVMRRLTADFSL